MRQHFFSSSALNRQLLQCSTAFQVESLILSSPIQDFSVQNTTRSLFVLGKHKSRHAQAIDKVLHLTRHQEFSPSQLSAMSYSLALGKLCSTFPPHLLEKISQADWRLCDETSLTQLMWSLAKFRIYTETSLFHCCTEAMLLFHHKFTPKQISQLLYSFACLKYPLPVSVVDRLLPNGQPLDAFLAQDLSLVLWSMATMDVHHVPFLRAFSLHVISRPDTLKLFSHQALANSLWSLAKLQHRDNVLLSVFVKEMSTGRNLHEWKPVDFSNSLWALAKLDYKAVSLFCFHVSQELKMRSSSFSLQELCNVLYGFAHMQHGDSCDIIVQQVLLRPKWTPQTVSNLLWSLSELDHSISSEKLFSRIESMLQQQEEEFSDQDLSLILLSMAKLRQVRADLVCAVLKQVRKREKMSPRCLCNILWAIACMDLLPLLAGHDVETWMNKIQQEDMSAESHHQLAQIYLAAKVEKNAGVELKTMAVPPRPADFLPSETHKQVSGLLHNQFSDLQEEVLIEGSMYVDIFLPQQRAVVEIYGPKHYFRNVPEAKNGRTLFKERLVRALGYQLLELKTNDFRKMDDAHKAQFVEKLALEIVNNK